MNIFALLWIEIIKRPIFNILVVLLSLFGWELWWAIIVLTIIIRFLLLKSSTAGTQMQKSMGDLQPKLQEIQEKYKDDPEKVASETMKLFKEKWGGPLKWCLTMLLQIPIFLGLFYVVRDFSNQEFPTAIYSFIEVFNISVGTPQTMFYGIDLLVGQSLILTLLAAVLMYAQMRMTQLTKPMQAPKVPGANIPDMSKMMSGMSVVFVGMMWIFVWSMPSAIGLYIVTSTLFGVIHHIIQFWPVVSAKLRARRGVPETIVPTDDDLDDRSSNANEVIPPSPSIK